MPAASRTALSMRPASVRRGSGGGADRQTLLHLAGMMVFSYVWMWHLSERAQSLPGASGFGWFFRYMTFCSFTLQTITSILQVLADLSQEHKAPKMFRLTVRLVDDLSCFTFAVACTVTVMYYGVEKSMKGGAVSVEGGAHDRPPWLNWAVHVLNSIYAAADVLLSEPRTFSLTAAGYVAAFCVAYPIWLLVIKQVMSSFPYPILEKLPFPHGFIFLSLAGWISMLAFFYTGRFFHRVTSRNAPPSPSGTPTAAEAKPRRRARPDASETVVVGHDAAAAEKTVEGGGGALPQNGKVRRGKGAVAEGGGAEPIAARLRPRRASSPKKRVLTLPAEFG
ncbi:unnamed protein product [Pedinophyceae sp. YPF-701]|nr:unnamed protein product [Pedinophyceae sp. YPF-701]